MSLTISAEGLVPDVIAIVRAAPNHGDTQQAEAVRAFVLAELAAWPTGTGAVNGVRVETAGSYDDRSRNVTVVIRPQWILPPED